MCLAFATTVLARGPLTSWSIRGSPYVCTACCKMAEASVERVMSLSSLLWLFGLRKVHSAPKSFENCLCFSAMACPKKWHWVRHSWPDQHLSEQRGEEGKRNRGKFDIKLSSLMAQSRAHKHVMHYIGSTSATQVARGVFMPLMSGVVVSPLLHISHRLRTKICSGMPSIVCLVFDPPYMLVEIVQFVHDGIRNEMGLEDLAGIFIGAHFP